MVRLLRPSWRCKAFPQCRRGAAAAEFAILAGPLFFLIIGIMEVCWQLLTGAALDHAALRASRFGATGGTEVPSSGSGLGMSRPDAVRWIISRSTGGLIQNNTRLTVTTAAWSGLGSFTGNGTAGAGNGSEIVSYTFTYKQPFISGAVAASFWGGDSITHTTMIIVMNEPF